MKHILAIIILILVLTSQVNAAIPPANVVRVFVEDQDGQSVGTGILIRSDLIITNYHVVRDRAVKGRVGIVRVLFPDWSVHIAKVIKTDKRWDLAALRIKPVLLPPMEFGSQPKINEIVIVGGYGPGWYETDSGGVLKFYQPNRNAARDWIQIAAKARKGDSGGPILRNGKLVGVLFGYSDGVYGTSIKRVCKFLKQIK